MKLTCVLTHSLSQPPLPISLNHLHLSPRYIGLPLPLFSARLWRIMPNSPGISLGLTSRLWPCLIRLLPLASALVTTSVFVNRKTASVFSPLFFACLKIVVPFLWKTLQFTCLPGAFPVFLLPSLWLKTACSFPSLNAHPVVIWRKNSVFNYLFVCFF